MHEIITKSGAIQTSKGIAVGMRVEWPSGSLIIFTAPKGWLCCGIFDLAALDNFDQAVAIVQSTPDNIIGTLDRMVDGRPIQAVNEHAAALGVKVGMTAIEALECMF